MTDTFVEYDFDPRNLPTEYLAAIGLAVAASAQTEHMLGFAIAGCAGLDMEHGGAITTHMAVPLKISALKSLSTIALSVEDLNQLDGLISNVEAALGKRNWLAHNTWCRNPQTGKVFTVKETARTHFQMDLESVTIDQIKREAAFIYDAGIELSKFFSLRGIEPDLPKVRDRASKTPAARKQARKGP
jgi:hypothetical protein